MRSWPAHRVVNGFAAPEPLPGSPSIMCDTDTMQGGNASNRKGEQLADSGQMIQGSMHAEAFDRGARGFRVGSRRGHLQSWRLEQVRATVMTGLRI
jgi:hypothetical protein